ncbi:MAG: ferredoxin [Candidatus Brocadiaceae bacterium]|jgi:ferredoxin
MKIEVDEDLCVGASACEDICPQVFEVVEGISQVKVDDVPADLEDLVREAVDSCPVGAIAIVE